MPQNPTLIIKAPPYYECFEQGFGDFFSFGVRRFRSLGCWLEGFELKDFRYRV